MDLLSLRRLNLPVHAEKYSGLGKVRGVLSFDGERLLLSYQTSDSVFGLIRSGPQELEIPLTAIERMRAGWGFLWLNPYVEFKFSDFALGTTVPGSDGSTGRMQVRFADRGVLRKLVDAVNFSRSQRLHEVLTQGLDIERPLPQPRLAAEVDAEAAPLPRRREFD